MACSGKEDIACMRKTCYEDIVVFVIAWVLLEADAEIKISMQMFIKECLWDQYGWKGRGKNRIVSLGST